LAIIDHTNECNISARHFGVLGSVCLLTQPIHAPKTMNHCPTQLKLSCSKTISTQALNSMGIQGGRRFKLPMGVLLKTVVIDPIQPSLCFQLAIAATVWIRVDSPSNQHRKERTGDHWSTSELHATTAPFIGKPGNIRVFKSGALETSHFILEPPPPEPPPPAPPPPAG
jgi:hypothetical protein